MHPHHWQPGQEEPKLVKQAVRLVAEDPLCNPGVAFCHQDPYCLEQAVSTGLPAREACTARGRDSVGRVLLRDAAE